MRQRSTWLGRTSAALALVMLSTVAVMAAPAGAVTDDERFTAYDDAAIAVTEEVGWLVRLGALAEPVPPSIASIPDAIGLPVLSRVEMIEALKKADGSGPRVWNALLATGDTPSVAVRDALRLIPQAAMEMLAAGGDPGLPAGGYEVAYGDILHVWGPLFDAGAQRTSAVQSPASPNPDAASSPTPTFGATAGSGEQDVTTPTDQVSTPTAPNGAPVVDGGGAPGATLAPRPVNPVNPAKQPVPQVNGSATATTTPARAETSTPTIATSGQAGDGTTAQPRSTESGGASSPAPFVAAAAAGALLLAAVVWWLLRRRRGGADRRTGATTAVAVDDLFELSRVLPTLRTPEAVADHAVHVVRTVVGADAAVSVVDEQLVPLAGELQLGASALRPVLEAGTRVRKVIGEQAFVAAPLVTSGRVCGAVVVSRSGKGFTVAVEEQLGKVATLMASSLQAAFDHRDAERMAYVDGLTQVANRRRFDLDLSDALRNAHAGAAVVSLAMVDIDHFKRLNDTYGHQTGDAVLREVAATIKANVRDGDVVYRYGGEEFAVLLPGADAAQAAEVVERVRAAVQRHEIRDDRGEPIEVTVSVGVARSLADEPRDLLAAADSALYEAKDAGRNRVVIADR